MQEKKEKSGKGYEELIHKIYKDLEPSADVRINDKIYGRDSGINREIDVSIRHKIADHEILIIIQAKDYKAKADVKVVGEFASVIRDVGASKGILICRGGFTATAKKLAKSYKIDLYSAHDAEVVKWQAEIQIPIIWESYDFKPFELKWKLEGAINAKTLLPSFGELNIEHFSFSTMFETETGEKINFIELFIREWDNDESWRKPGEHKFTYVGLIKYLSNGYLVTCSNLSFNYNLIKKNFLKYVSPTEYQGIKNHENNNFRLTKLKINDKVNFLDDGTWKQVDLKKIPAKVFTINMEILDFGMGKFIRSKGKI